MFSRVNQNPWTLLLCGRTFSLLLPLPFLFTVFWGSILSNDCPNCEKADQYDGSRYWGNERGKIQRDYAYWNYNQRYTARKYQP